MGTWLCGSPYIGRACQEKENLSFVLFCFLISMSIHYENMSPKQGTTGSRSTGEWEEGQMLVLHWDGLWDVCGHTWGPNPC